MPVDAVGKVYPPAAPRLEQRAVEEVAGGTLSMINVSKRDVSVSLRRLCFLGALRAGSLGDLPGMWLRRSGSKFAAREGRGGESGFPRYFIQPVELCPVRRL